MINLTSNRFSVAFNHHSTACMETHLQDAMASRYEPRKGTGGLLKSCREFAGRGDNHAVQQRRRGKWIMTLKVQGHSLRLSS